MSIDLVPKKSDNAKGVLRWAALFLGELRDGLTMVRTSCDETRQLILTLSDLTLLCLDQYAKRVLDGIQKLL